MQGFVRQRFGVLKYGVQQLFLPARDSLLLLGIVVSVSLKVVRQLLLHNKICAFFWEDSLAKTNCIITTVEHRRLSLSSFSHSAG